MNRGEGIRGPIWRLFHNITAPHFFVRFSVPLKPYPRRLLGEVGAREGRDDQKNAS
jgi:hypothetical protein